MTLGRLAVGLGLALLVALSTIQKSAIAAESAVSEKPTICDTDEARESGKYWSYDLTERLRTA